MGYEDVCVHGTFSPILKNHRYIRTKYNLFVLITDLRGGGTVLLNHCELYLLLFVFIVIIVHLRILVQY